jgi:hypothetical protein
MEGRIMKYILLQHEWKNTEKSKTLNNIKTKVRKTFDDEELDGEAKKKMGEYLNFLYELKELGELDKNIGFSFIVLGDD